MKLLSLILVASLAVPVRAETTAHIASPEQISSELIAASNERTQALDAVGTLAGPEARAAVATLSSVELADLADRATALRTDPVAGASTGLIILASVGAVLILLLIIGAITCAGDDSC